MKSVRIHPPSRAYRSYLLLPLEPRVLLSVGPGQVLTLADRQNLLDNMTLSASLASSLQSALNSSNLASFDQQLLDYFRARAANHFFFESSDVPSYATYINANLNTGDVFNRANAIMSNLYPEQDGSETFTVSVPDDVDWDKTGYSSNPETIHTLNRHFHWVDLAMAHRLSGTASYATKLIGQLADWSQENPPLSDPNTWQQNAPRWWLLDTSIRAETWSWTYMLMLGSSQWSKEANTLALVKMLQHGQFLYAVTPRALNSNQALVHGQGLLYIAQVFPEFSAAGTLETYSRDLLFDSMDAQLYNDGSHVEQSPNYAQVITERLVETKKLDSVSGFTWPSERSNRLTNAINAYYQFLSPDGNTPAIGDTYRSSSSTLWLKANLTQGVTTWPAARPRVRDAWLFGTSAINPHLGNPITPALGNRGLTYALTDSGNYIFRSGSDANARQIIFDAGPKGNGHGHFDLLNFELFGYGAPLIADPGPYKYDSSAQRTWALSTPAHNTISIDGANHGALEGKDNPGFGVTQWDVASDHVQVTAYHFAYGGLAGRPVVARSVWYDKDGTILVVDWGESVESHEFATSFTLPGTSNSSNLPAGRIQSTNAGGNVKIQTLLQTGQAAFRQTADRFTSSSPPPNHSDPATRFYVTQTGTFVCFATLITAYNGTTAPDISAQLLNTPLPGKQVKIRLTKNGVAKDIAFLPPTLQRLNSNATSRGSYSDLAFDQAGRLHLVYMDRDTKELKYTVRSTNGKWSIVETIDNQFLSGYDPSIAITSTGRVGIAYTQANHGDLKYAFHNGSEWLVESVDVPGSTGHYPSLAFSRNNGPVITYYNKSKGDLMMASSATNGWAFSTIDSGQIGTKDVGRFSHLVLDPTRPTASKWAIAYEDTGGGRYRYAIQGNILGGEQRNGYTFFDIDTTTTKLGGYTYLAFDGANRPTVSFYDSANTGLKFARSSGDTFTGISFTSNFVVTKNAVGYYSNLYYDSTGKANIFYFDRTLNVAWRARNTTGSTWSFSQLAPGGREIHVARFGSTVAWTNLNEAVPSLEVLF